MDRKNNKLLKTSPWPGILIGVAVGLVIAILLIKKSYCLNEYQPGTIGIFPGMAVIGTIATVVTSLSKYIFPKKFKISGGTRKILLAAGGLFLAIGITLSFSPFVYRIDKNYCVKDFDQLVYLTNQEGTAVINKDMDIIHAIYVPDAVITRVDQNKSWPAYVYYSEKFANEEHCTNSHGNFDVVSYTATEVTMTTSSQGTWGWKGQGCTFSFANPPGSNQWTFIRVGKEWKIINFEFNKPVPAQ